MFSAAKIIKGIALCSIILVCDNRTHAQGTYPGSTPVNYVRVWDLRAPEQNHLNISSRPLKDALQSTMYSDGLGRVLQTVVKQGALTTATAASADLVTPQHYDVYGRTPQVYLPFAATDNQGGFKYNPFDQQVGFYNTQLAGQSEQYFYQQHSYEPSPLNRVIKSTAPGSSWTGSNRGVNTVYGLNDANDDVKSWTVYGSGSYGVSSTYANGQLSEITTIDEDGKQVVEYKDKEDKTILKKVQQSPSPSAGYSGWMCTYYLYDDFGLLRLVIQPKGVEYMLQYGWSINSTILAEQCFEYNYDGRGRMIEKRVPGAGLVEMVYDARDRVTLTRDANMLATGKWMFTKYDDLNRVVQTGFVFQGASRATFQYYGDSYVDFPMHWWSNEVLTETYYDNYSWSPASYGLSDALNLSWGSFAAEDNSNFPYPRGVVKSNDVHGMVTGTKVKQLGGSGGYLYSVMIYDKDGRVLQTQRTNITGGVDITTTQYSFSGQPLRVVQRTQKAGANASDIVTTSEHSYDDLWRITATTKTVSGQANGQSLSASKQISQNSYDALGQLSKKVLAPYMGLEQLDYEYNIRGWLLGVNRGYLTGSGKRFGFELAYDKPGNYVGGGNYTPQYNGNIAGTTWKSMGDEEKRRYDFGYDAANRLLKANFGQFTSGGFNLSAGINYSVQLGDGVNGSSAYDVNGNIKSMQQWGVKGISSTVIDDLSYTYQNSLSNKLLAVNEVTLGSTNNYLGDFTDANTAVNDYSYDGNGNLIEDKNKGIGSIGYNHLNLPQQISVPAKGNITYNYDASGAKLSKTVTEGSSVKTTLYLGDMVFENDVFLFAGHEEGRLRKAASGVVAYDYFIKDHLGNTRMVLTDETNTQYYPTLSNEGGSGSGEANNQNAIWDDAAGNSIDIVNRRVNRPGNFGTTGTNGNYALSITKNTGGIGAGKLLKVMSGDIVYSSVDYFYHNNYADNSSANGLGSILNHIAGVIAGTRSPAGTAVKSANGAAAGNLGADGLFTGLFAPQSPSGGYTYQPKAYMHILLFDEQFKFDAANSYVVQVSAWVQESRQTLYGSASAKKNGYAYIYFSNESNDVVFFDNFNLTHQAGPLLEETHYYPFGLTMGGISSKAFARLENKKQYNSIEHTTDLDLNQYDAFFRNLDPQIGRFIQIDPETESQENVSPFESMGNNPILNVDPLGDFKTRFGAWWHSLWHGGTVGKNSNGEYFVSKPIETESSEDGSVTVGVSVAYGKGRHALSAAGERMQAENNKQVFEDRMLNMGIWQRHETLAQANEATFKNSIGFLLPYILKGSTGIINTTKPIANSQNIISRTINSGQQGKHIIGHNNYQSGRSILSESAQELLDAFHAGNINSSQTINSVKTRVDFGKVIGNYKNQETGQLVPTTKGIIHNGKNGAHIVPSSPN